MAKKFKKEVPIFLSVDDNYIPFLAVCVESIKAHSNKDTLYKMHILCESISTRSRTAVNKLQTENITIEFVNVSSKVNPVRRELEITLRDYYTVSIFYRMFIPSLFPQYKKALYIDSDIVLLDDIAKLYDTDLEKNLLGAVPDQVVLYNDDLRYYVETALGVNADTYFNSGVLVMNLDEFRKQNIEKKFLDTLIKYQFETVAPDQDYLNVLCENQVKYLPAGWDRMPTVNVKDEGKIYLVHYNMFDKPWRYFNVMFEEYFWEYARRTTYYKKLLDTRANYTDAQKQADKLGGMMLVKSALKIASSKNTFRNVFKGE